MDINNTLCSQQLNTTYYQTVFEYTHPEGTLVTTYSQLFSSLQSQLLTSMLYSNILFLILSIMVIETTRNTVPSWYELSQNGFDKRTLVLKIMRSIAGITFILSLFGTFLLISIKMGYNW